MLHKINMLADINNKKALIINHSIDDRNNTDIISSHSSLYKGLSKNMNVISTNNLGSVNVENYDIIGVDEVNFFSKKDLLDTIRKWLTLDKYIYCSGLDSNYLGEKFGAIHHLLHLSDTFIKLNAKCTICSNELLTQGKTVNTLNSVNAPFTKKIINDGLMIDSGGDNKYIAVCRKHLKY